MDFMDKTRLKVINDFKANHPFSFECIKDMGRVEGAIKELKLIIKKNSSFKYSRMDMIEFCEKRLKKKGLVSKNEY